MVTLRTFTVRKLPKDREFRGQQKLIVDFMIANPQSTIPQITQGIVGKLETRQAPERVVSYYMATMKKKGWVVEEAVTVETTTAGDVAAEEGVSVDDVVADDEEELEDATINEEDAASTGATKEERMEAIAEADLVVTSLQIEQSMRVTDAILHILTGVQVGLDVETLIEMLNTRGYIAKKAQVLGALNNLIRRGVVRRLGNRYEVRA